ncbi:MAG: hypothetical protein DRN04_05125 [Thermoprotei archaeon]|mgnify:FL=1|nr:MAG: hypothetical protein DRN04_05125 [Thermoprotei archaeon]
MSSVCPALYRDNKGNFICSYTKSLVDPVAYPCLGNFFECPIFTEYRTKKKKEISKAQPVAPKREAIETQAPTLPDYAASIVNSLSQLEEDLRKLNVYWSAYEKAAQQVLKKWFYLRDNALKELTRIEGLIGGYLSEIREIGAKLKLEMIDKETAEKLVKHLEARIEELRNKHKEISEKVDTIQKLIEPHEKRIVVHYIKANIPKLKEELAKLEELYKSGKISKEYYEKIKRILEYHLKNIEKAG